MNILASFAGYILCLHHYGLTLTDVFMTAKYFVLGADDFVVGSRVYSGDEQMKILGSLQAAYYFNLVLSQVRRLGHCSVRGFVALHCWSFGRWP